MLRPRLDNLFALILGLGLRFSAECVLSELLAKLGGGVWARNEWFRARFLAPFCKGTLMWKLVCAVDDFCFLGDVFLFLCLLRPLVPLWLTISGTLINDELAKDSTAESISVCFRRRNSTRTFLLTFGDCWSLNIFCWAFVLVGTTTIDCWSSSMASPSSSMDTFGLLLCGVDAETVDFLLLFGFELATLLRFLLANDSSRWSNDVSESNRSMLHCSTFFDFLDMRKSFSSNWFPLSRRSDRKWKKRLEVIKLLGLPANLQANKIMLNLPFTSIGESGGMGDGVESLVSTGLIVCGGGAALTISKISIIAGFSPLRFSHENEN